MKTPKKEENKKKGKKKRRNQRSLMKLKVAERFKIDALFGMLLPYTRIFISYNSTRAFSATLRWRLGYF